MDFFARYLGIGTSLEMLSLVVLAIIVMVSLVYFTAK